MIELTKFLYDAQSFARVAHFGQKRIGTNHSYWTHTELVAELVASKTENEVTIAAAFLHDTIEDTKATCEIIMSRFGFSVADLVLEVTNVYTSQDYSIYARRERKAFERERYLTVSPEAKLIKLCDLIDNSKNTQNLPKKFALVYMREALALMSQLALDPDLRQFERE